MVTLNGAIRMADTVVMAVMEAMVDTADTIRVLALCTAATQIMATTVDTFNLVATTTIPVATVVATVVAPAFLTFVLQPVQELQLLLQRHNKASWSTLSRNMEVIKNT